MATNLIILLRVLFTTLLSLLGLFALSIAMWMVAYRDFVLFAGPGAIMAAAVLVGVGLLYASGRLFKTTLRLPAA